MIEEINWIILIIHNNLICEKGPDRVREKVV